MEQNKQISLKEMAAASQFNKERDYWLTRLSGELVKSSFPSDFQQPAPQKTGAADKNMPTVTFCLAGDLLARLMKLRNGLDSTLYMVLAAGVILLLEKYTGNNDIIVGTTILKQEDNANFINTVLALRNRLEPHMTFKDLLLQVRQTVLEAVKHQNYPLEKLLYQLDIPVVEGSFPLFDTGVILQNIHDRDYFGRIDLNILFVFFRNQESLEGILEYNPAVYDRSSMQRLVEHFTYLMHQAVFNIDMKLSQLQVLSPQELQQITWDFNATETNYPANRTVPELFADQVEKTPLHTAIIHREKTLTLKQVAESAQRLANYLHREKGICPDEIVGILMNNSPELVIAMFGILSAGAAYVPLDPSLPVERMRFILKDARVREVISLKSFNRVLERSDTGWRGACPARWNHLVYMIYTSGTTGKPRGVMIDHRSLVNYLYWAIKQYTGPGRSTFPLYTTPSFDLTVTSIYLPLLTGSPLLIYDQDKPDKGQIPVQEVIEHNAAELVKATPSHLKILQYTYINSPAEVNRDNPLSRSRVRAFIVGGEELSSQLARAIYRHFPGQVDIYNEYGPTEATVGCMIYKFNDTTDNRRGVPIGTPVDNVKIYLLDASLNPVPIGATGEIYIGGDALARGYLNLPELTAEKFIKNPYLPPGTYYTYHASRLYKTGDLACLLPGGILEYTGRKDEQVKIRGYRVEIKDIENCLLGLEKIAKVVVTAQTDDGAETYLCAYYKAQEEVAGSEIRKYLSAALPDYMIPSYFVRIDRIPLTLNGKIDKKSLPRIKNGGGGSRHKYIPPGNRLEEILVDIWARVLKLDKESIGIDAEFFELGGHSLRATIMVSNIHKALNIKVPLAEIFKTPTIRALAHYIKGKTEEKFLSIPPVEKMEYYTLSPAQRRLYILQQMKEDNIGYNVYSALVLEGRVDKSRLEETFKKLIARHESLRTYFVRVGDEMMQRIAAMVEFCVDYSEVDGDPLEGIISQFVRPFELDRAPLLRVRLVRFDKDRYWMIYDMHHIITDGISMTVLTKEFAALYAGEWLEPLRIQYKDFSQWQNGITGQEVLKLQESYWLGEFREDIPVLSLTTDFPRPAVQVFAGDKLQFHLGTEETSLLNACGLKQDVTLFMLILGAYNVLLSRLSGQQDIVVGTPIAGRRHADLQQVIGMFVNTLALRNYPGRDRQFNDFLREIKQRTLEAFENQEYPFEALVEKVTVQRDLGRNPLFDMIIAVQNMESQIPGVNGVHLADLELKPAEFPHKISKFDLAMHVTEIGEELLFTLEYSTALFKKKTVERIYSYFIKAALAAAADPLKKINEIEIISQEEKEWILSHFNDTSSAYPREKTVSRLFEEQVEYTPDRIAVIDESRQLTYRELNRQIGRLAGRLYKEGLKTGDIAAVMMAQSMDLIIAIMGILKAGAAYLPIDPNHPQERIDYMLKDSTTRVLLTTTENVFTFHHSSFIIHDSSQLAYIIYTSGTTGRPKGVMVEHRSLVNLCYWHNRYYNVNESDRALEYARIGFDASVWEMFPYLLCGASLCIINEGIKLDIAELNRYFERQGITIAFLPTQVCEQFIQLENRSLRKLLTGGDKLRSFKKKPYEIYNNYGPTENTVVSTACLVEEYSHNIPIGKPTANTGIYIVAPGGRGMNLQPVGVPGELCVGGDGLSRGYLNNPELTAEKFIFFPNLLTSKLPNFHLYRTGDLARWLEDGNIEFLGRIDFQVKVRGNRIELGEIEALLLTHEKIKDALVTAPVGPNGDTYLCAYIVAQKETGAPELREYLGKRLPGYMIPAYFVLIDHIPLTVNGKVDRGALPAPVITPGQNYAAPRDTIEEKLIAIWSEVLGIEKNMIGIDSDFFELGGHSLKATIVVSKINMMLDVKVPLSVMFLSGAASIRGLSGYIKTSAKSKYTAIEPVEKKEYYGLSHAQKRLWIIEQMKENQTAYNIPITFQLKGTLDIHAFERAFLGLIERHEILRTVFITINGEPKQKIIKSSGAGFNLDYIDLRNRENPGESARLLALAELKKGFALEKGPLLRVKLMRIEAEKYIFQLILHHIISDGWSMNILFSELLNVYHTNTVSGLNNLDSGTLPEPLSIQYKDYTVWQNKQVTAPGLNSPKEYWLRQFKGEIPVIKLPTDKKRPPVKTFNGNRVDFIIDAEMKTALAVLGQRTGTSLFMILLAAVDVVLYLYTQQEDIVIGSPAAGRLHTQLENQVGFYVNTLPIRVVLTGIATFEELLQKIKQTALEAYENQVYPFDLIVEDLALTHDPARNPLFDVMVVLQNDNRMYPIPVVKDLQISGFDTGQDTSTFELNFQFTELPDRIHLNLIYDSDLFEEVTIEIMGTKLLNLIKKAVDDEPIRLKDIHHDHLLPALNKKSIGAWEIEF